MTHVTMTLTRHAVMWRTDDGRTGSDPVIGPRFMWPTIRLILNRLDAMEDGGQWGWASAEIHAPWIKDGPICIRHSEPCPFKPLAGGAA